MKDPLGSALNTSNLFFHSKLPSTSVETKTLFSSALLLYEKSPIASNSALNSELTCGLRSWMLFSFITSNRLLPRTSLYLLLPLITGSLISNIHSGSVFSSFPILRSTSSIEPSFVPHDALHELLASAKLFFWGVPKKRPGVTSDWRAVLYSSSPPDAGAPVTIAIGEYSIPPW